MEEYMLPCLNKKLFGFECLGCGLQRSLFLIFKGEFIAAFYMYPAVYFLLVLVMALSISLVYPYKYSSRIVQALSILAVGTATGSYIFKHWL